jgi:hypothetical protein
MDSRHCSPLQATGPARVLLRHRTDTFLPADWRVVSHSPKL